MANHTPLCLGLGVEACIEHNILPFYRPPSEPIAITLGSTLFNIGHYFSLILVPLLWIPHHPTLLYSLVRFGPI